MSMSVSSKGTILMIFYAQNKIQEEKNDWKSCLQGELNPNLLGDWPRSWPLDQVVSNEIEKKILWTD